jgi:hypothetical protein
MGQRGPSRSASARDTVSNRIEPPRRAPFVPRTTGRANADADEAGLLWSKDTSGPKRCRLVRGRADVASGGMYVDRTHSARTSSELCHLSHGAKRPAHRLERIRRVHKPLSLVSDRNTPEARHGSRGRAFARRWRRDQSIRKTKALPPHLGSHSPRRPRPATKGNLAVQSGRQHARLRHGRNKDSAPILPTPNHEANGEFHRRSDLFPRRKIVALSRAKRPIAEQDRRFQAPHRPREPMHRLRPRSGTEAI